MLSQSTELMKKDHRDRHAPKSAWVASQALGETKRERETHTSSRWSSKSPNRSSTFLVALSRTRASALAGEEGSASSKDGVGDVTGVHFDGEEERWGWRKGEGTRVSSAEGRCMGTRQEDRERLTRNALEDVARSSFEI